MLTLLSPTKICKFLLIGLFVFFLPMVLSAQNIFPEKINICNTLNFCIDCGNPKATCDQFTLDYICDKINRKYILKDAYGSISFQVLVEPTGFSCVLSHTDVTNTPITVELIRYLNGNIWRPAIENGKPVFSSVVVVFRFAYGRISAQMQRVDLTELKPPGDPVIYNKKTVYANPSLKTYEFTTWTKYNSPLPDNVSRSCAIDKSDILWYASAKGITRFDGENFNAVNEFNSPFTSETAVSDITVDKDNNTWVYANNKMYRYNDAGWQIYDFKKFLASGVTRILHSRHGELLFTTKDGLVVLRKDKVVLLNKKRIPKLPSNNIYYAFDDSQKRLWIGTSKGTIMIDKEVITNFNTSDTPLKNVYISGAAEDEKGNLYFSLVDCNETAGDNDKEGIAVLKTNGRWLHYNDKNSGMPSNRVNDMLYDKNEHLLWIGTDQSGIVRFDMKDGWENYHNNNSAMPGHTIYQLVQDSKGVIYATTANGLLRLRKK
ncbi:ligand-binding sensor domain-containing protein [Mucilaginibacter pocheonensis]|uniref:Ligand-binding sensor domain-containing protein n=1 Tax=Mucilaginibacter pocheonensis TaxID=398050 RepID=A0ABU1T802_9SPHI|nr:two-component regulator propeller domain-containing protein [Mucilaginibacter pocheonensis]MDR6940935.1 ligand-binding sensor domain-containing protein [Mucilaginibacter pocheonensis]